MSSYTIKLYDIINNFYSKEEVKSWFSSYKLEDYLTSEQINVISQHGTWNKDKLAEKILNRYMMNEIAFETIGLFKHKVMGMMEEIMSTKLLLIYTASIDYDIMINVDFTETFTRNIEENGSTSAEGTTEGHTTSSSEGSGLSINSDTPQGQINKTDILAGNYATSTTGNENTVTDTTNTNSSSNNSATQKNNTIETYQKNTKGNSGISATYQKMIEQFRENIIAIDNDIINDLRFAFFGLYSI